MFYKMGEALLKWVLIMVLIFSCSSSTTRKDEPKEFTQIQLSEDLQQLISKLKALHSGLFWYQTKSDFQEAVESINSEIVDGMNLIEFYKSVNKLISGIGCGHTRSQLSKNRSDLFFDSAYFLPLKVTVINNQLIVNEDYGVIKKGSNVVSINDYAIEDILDELGVIVPSDGYNVTGKDHYISKRFNVLFALYFESNLETLEVTYRSQNRIDMKSEKIELVGINELSNADHDNPLLSFVDLDEGKAKLLTIRTFSSNYLSSKGFEYYKFIENTFKQLRVENVKNLIIDVRGNGGGDDNYGATLVSYITDQVFGYFDTIEVTKEYDGWGDIVDSENGKRLMTSHRDLAKHEPAEYNFKGNVYILSDGGSFSTTADFVSISKELKAAKIIGVETGGGACGNTSGSSRRIVLKHTGISVNIPMWNYHSSIDQSTVCGHGVFPDYEVFDLPYTGKDEIMHKALELVGTKN